MSKLTLGSLFDGSGGFPFAGTIAGITPVWASEIEPFPIRVTTKRLPQMKHYGDVRKLNGTELEPVDIITFGSPCQDLSIAGKRGGLESSRSGLFYEATRIIREMRRATDGKYPRYAVWENVPGALSSNGGEDFRAVLEALCSIKESVYVPQPKRWTPAGEILGDGLSVAWRTLDAQYWGIPQRRKRIYLVADFAGESAGKILFDAEGMSGNSEKSIRAWKRAAGRTEGGTGTTGEPQIMTFGIGGHNSRGMLSANPHAGFYEAETSRTIDCNGGNPSAHQGGIAVVESQVSQMTITPKTLKIRAGCEGGGKGALVQENKSATLSCNNDQTLFVPSVYGLGRAAFNQGVNATYSPPVEKELQPAIVASGAGAVCAKMCVRRLTPTECARLQGFPDWWCENLETENPTDKELDFWRGVFATIGKNKPDVWLRKWLKNPRTDTAEYKMWGNGVALPCAVFVLFGIACRIKD